MRRCLVALAGALLVASTALSGDELKPVVDGREGQRAFDELATYYADNTKPPAYQQAIKDLSAPDEQARTQAGRYLLALFKQMFADETTGRSPWRRLPYWGGGVEIDARKLRKTVAKAFGKGAQGEAALGAALWLIEGDRQAENAAAGVRVLRRIVGPRVTPVLKRLLAQPHPNKDVVVAVVEEVAERGLKDLALDIVRLCIHYRAPVREAARAAATRLGVADLPEFKPEEAFTPWLDERLRAIAAMVMAEIPEGAPFKRFTVTHPPQLEGGQPWVEEFSAWVLGKDDTHYRVLTVFGEEKRVEKQLATAAEWTLVEEAEVLLAARQSDDRREAMKVLSRRGSLTGQFEAGLVSAPEALVAAWSYVRGDRGTAAGVLFPRLEAMPDNRWLVAIVRDLLGHLYHQSMLRAFSYDRDYDRAVAFAHHLSKPLFEGYQYQERAKRLAEQLAQRGDDFSTFVLPAAEQWEGLKAEMSRRERVKFLAQRLRLLNCMQQGQPGDVHYDDPQFASPQSLLERRFPRPSEDAFKKLLQEEGVINPHTELKKMELTVAELTVLVPFLADENYMPTFSYWRDFHHIRTLHQVNWAVVGIVNQAAQRDLARLRTYTRLDEEGRKKHLQRIMDWCKANAGKSRDELVLETLDSSAKWPEFHAAAKDAVRHKNTQALTLLINRIDDFPQERGKIAELCHGLDSPDAAPAARRWLEDRDEEVRFWGTLILLKHGDTAHSEGLSELRAILKEDDSVSWYPHAIDPLLASQRQECLELACGILKKERFEPADWNSQRILHRLFLAGRRECLDYLLEVLDKVEPYGWPRGAWKGDEVEGRLVVGDMVAVGITRWRTDGYQYVTSAPNQARRKERERLKAWLKEQFDRITSGQEPDMKLKPEPLLHSEWELDAP